MAALCIGLFVGVVLSCSDMRASQEEGVSSAGDGDALVEGDASEATATSSCTTETFLDELEERSVGASGEADATDGSAADAGQGYQEVSGDITVTWEEEAGLVEVAGAVLRAYEETGDAMLVTSGYLDLKGTVWSALVQGAGWVDVVAVRSALDDGSSTVRVARLLPDGASAS